MPPAHITPAPRIGFFGGTFDPPHLGHLAVARAAADRFSLDEVLLAPVAHQPLKTAASSASFADRLAMASLMAEADARFSVSDVDAEQQDGRPNYTVDTLARLRGRVTEQTRLFVIVGADSLRDLPRWHDPPRLLALAELIAVSRPGEDLSAALSKLRAAFGEELFAEMEPRIHCIEGVEQPVSATTLRHDLANNDAAASEWLLPGVLQYIQAHHLYGNEA
ncbi:nicotinate (nicotinamide) nucleotide adenylyltransferase [Granulicella cerasi]|uniref:Probable nicotinate-nucleotide adenylyltransferase n=1 Tax=Granulicella cerasi TaxID=741063 RepID=A0ABW1Z933_9BACT|nr:nicotinate (nicotinamide) nucleotide adenylyltransferase [Granulicella cerasi]